MSPSAESPQGTGPILEFAEVTKSFHGVRVLDRVSFAVGRGRSIGLVGENGAGKSTLMNILGGSLRPDSGFLRLDGVEYSPQNPLEAQRNGIAFIHQELNLFSNLDIAENISICDFPRYRGLPLIDRRELRRRAAAAVVRVGLDLSPDTLVEDLSAGERQLVEIAKALRQEPRILILDEPTTSLSARESARLFELLRALRRGGLSMIYISHDLGDVFQLADDLVVLRDGAVVGSGLRGDFDEDRLVSLMVGRSVSRVSPARTGPASEEPALELRGVTQPGVVRDISLRLARGEVLGIAGLMGSGRSELARIIFGVDPHASGEILVKGLPRGKTAPGASIRSGMAFVTEDRREDGLALDAAIDENVALVTLRTAARGPLRILDGRPLRAAVEGIRRRVGLPASADGLRAAKTLSGGNQQKVVLAKWLLAEPSVLILDEPTRGIDVGAKFEIHGLVSDLARRGAGILLISSEIEELLGISDRILVMARGEIRDELRRDDFDRERILRAALGDPSRSGRGEATP